MSIPLDESRAARTVLQEREDCATGTWVNVVTHLDARYGGLSAVVPRLASEIAASGSHDIHIAAFCGPEESCAIPERGEATLSTWPCGRMNWFTAPGLTAQFRRTVENATGIHIHGLWEQSSSVAASAALRLGKPYIISAHGMLESWALRNKRIKKAVYASLIERRNLQRARCLHALTQAEAEDYRRFGLKAPIAIIPNGVAIPARIDPELLLATFPSLRGKRIVLFLGRLHCKKGLDILIEAWSRLGERWPEAHLVLAGPDFENTRTRIEALIAKHSLEHSIQFTGMLGNEMKWSALAAAECFILPSYSEGLSVSTLEAMGAGVPVIISENCNLPDVSVFDAGWVIKPTADEICVALREVLNNPHELNARIGQRGRMVVNRDYNWSRVAAQMSEVYTWLEGGTEPSCVEVLWS